MAKQTDYRGVSSSHREAAKTMPRCKITTRSVTDIHYIYFPSCSYSRKNFNHDHVCTPNIGLLIVDLIVVQCLKFVFRNIYWTVVKYLKSAFGSYETFVPFGNDV
jgi:hypothetical protein